MISLAKWARAALTTATVLPVLAGCGLMKRDDAEDAKAMARRFAMTIEPQSSLSRTAGMTTRTRLLGLFPDHIVNSADVLPAIDFALEGATGSNRAFGQQSRPYDPLAQMALREKITTLCEKKLSVPGATATLFKLDSTLLLKGEVAPTDSVEALALAAARNGWLHPYMVSDTEVQELIKLYRTVQASTASEGGTTGARKAVCMATLLAPQFWMGTPEKSDAARRVSIELFRRIPTMQELKDYVDGKFTLSQYFDKLMSDSTASASFSGVIRQWHEEWLGFREFFDTSSNARSSDRRLVNDSISRGQIGNAFVPAEMTIAGLEAIKPHPNAASPIASSCTSATAQNFDPDTNMILWEHYNYDVGAFNFVGGFIRSGGTLVNTDSATNRMSLDDVANAIVAAGDSIPANTTTAARAIVSDLCGKYATIADQDGVLWQRCNGLLALNSASLTRLKTTMLRLIEVGNVWNTYSQATAGMYPMNAWCVTSDATCITNHQNWAKAVRNNMVYDLKQLSDRVKGYDANSGAIIKNAIAGTSATQGFARYASYVMDAGSIWTTNYDAAWAQWGTVNDCTTSSSTGTTFGCLVNQLNTTSSTQWYYETDLSQTTQPVSTGTASLAGGGTEERFRYKDTGFDRFASLLGGDGSNLALPLNNTADSVVGFSKSARRVRRLGGTTNTWQDGYSNVKLWATGGEVRVCNAADRFWVSCAYRPAPKNIAGEVFAKYRADQGYIWAGTQNGQWMPDSVMHPLVATSFYCGSPDLGVLSSYDTTLPNKAWSKKIPDTLNPVASYAAIVETRDDRPTGTALGNEAAVNRQIYTEVREEPYKLINKLVTENRDYRGLLTESKTTGSGCLKLYYDSQGYFLPGFSSAAGQSCTGPGTAEAEFGAGPSIPTGHLVVLSGTSSGKTAAYYQGETPSSGERSRMWSKVYGGPPAQLPPRLYSGILTMPAFVAPVATKARGIAARYFTRLLCDQPNFYDPLKDSVDAQAKLDMHRSFVSSRKHLVNDCFQCHRNLDPLSAALSWTFQGLLIPDPSNSGEQLNKNGGEGSAYDYLGELDIALVGTSVNIVGLRHAGAPPSSGAFMGQSVSGIVDLGKKVADSEKFASCVTQTVFNNVFGRPVQFADIQFFNSLVKDFKSKDKINYRYIDLIKEMIESDEFQRKN